MRFYLFVALVVVLRPLLYSQSLSEIDPPFYARLDFNVSNDRFDAAESMLKSRLKRSADKAPYWMELGKLDIARKKWYDARDWFEKVETERPDDMEVAYYLGICNREVGKFQATILRYLSLKASESYFRRVIARDSLYSDVFYQYALLHHLRKDYTKAIKTAAHQVIIKPILEEAWVGLFFLYRSFILHTNSANAEKWLAEDRSVFSDFFLAELYRQNRLYQRADSIYRNIIDGNYRFIGPVVNLARVRSKIEQGSPLEAEMIYWQTVKSVRDSLQARWLFEDLKYICIDNEIKEYHRTGSEGYKKFFTTFWRKRDPLPASPDNLRLIEHYRRLIYAEKEFRYDGYRTWNANPDQQGFLEFPKAFYLNRDLNDKGLIYIRHGDPDDKATALGETMRHNESWLYNERDGLPKLIFHFEIDEDGLAGDWRLTPMLRDEAAIQSVVMWDEAYSRYLRSDSNLKSQIANEIALVNKELISIAMKTDRHSWAKPVENLPVSFMMANFKQNDNVLSELYVEFPVTDIFPDSGGEQTLNLGMAVFDVDWDRISRSDQYISLGPNSPDIIKGDFIRTYRLLLRPASYRFVFHAEHLESPKLGGFRLNVTLPNYRSAKLMCSDILLAHSIALKDSTRNLSKNNMLAIPNPSRTFNRFSPLFAYIEFYNLGLDGQNRTKYSVTYQIEDRQKNKRWGFFGLFGRKKSTQISITTERTGTTRNEPELTVLDISSLDAGKKRLRILVNDQISNQTSEKEILFESHEE